MAIPSAHLISCEVDKTPDGKIERVTVTAKVIDADENSIIQRYSLNADEVKKYALSDAYLTNVLERMCAMGISRMQRIKLKSSRKTEYLGPSELGKHKVTRDGLAIAVARLGKLERKDKAMEETHISNIPVEAVPAIQSEKIVYRDRIIYEPSPELLAKHSMELAMARPNISLNIPVAILVGLLGLAIGAAVMQYLIH